MSLGVSRELLGGAGYQLGLERKPSSHAGVVMKGDLEKWSVGALGSVGSDGGGLGAAVSTVRWA